MHRWSKTGPDTHTERLESSRNSMRGIPVQCLVNTFEIWCFPGSRQVLLSTYSKFMALTMTELVLHVVLHEVKNSWEVNFDVFFNVISKSSPLLCVQWRKIIRDSVGQIQLTHNQVHHTRDIIRNFVWNLDFLESTPSQKLEISSEVHGVERRSWALHWH